MASSGPLVDVYDCAMFDLDGVVYVGPRVIDGVPDRLRQARKRNLTVAFVTNNASRTAEQVAQHLRDLGVEAAASDVVTSAQAAASEVAARVPSGERVLVIGGEGLEEALRERDFVPVLAGADIPEPDQSDASAPMAVVQGFAPSVSWRQLAHGAAVISSGALWVASNLDLTIPTAYGISPGNGTLVNAVAAAVGRRPDVVAGKPFRPLFDETVRRVSAGRPLVVGDRLDTDIEGATNCDADSLLVMTGVTDVAALLSATGAQRPDFVAWTLDGLFTSHAVPRCATGRWRLASWEMSVEDDVVVVHNRGDDADEGLRVATSAAWHWADQHPHHELRCDALDSVW